MISKKIDEHKVKHVNKFAEIGHFFTTIGVVNNGIQYAQDNPNSL